MGKPKQARVSLGRLAPAVIFVLLPGGAQAHAVVPGMGKFASGFLHPFFTPPHLLALLALGLMLGQRQPLRLRDPVAVFAVFAAAGLLLTVEGTVLPVHPPVLIALGLCAGVCVALARPWPWWLLVAASAAVALAVGLDSGVETGTPGHATMEILAATWVSLLLFVVNSAFYVSLLPKLRWAQTGIRVVGAWIVAIALLMLAFALRR